jgi:hypothetical protein
VDAEKCCILCGLVCLEKTLACKKSIGQSKPCARSRVHKQCAANQESVFICPDHDAGDFTNLLANREDCTEACVRSNPHAEMDIFECEHQNLKCSYCDTLVIEADHVFKGNCLCKKRQRQHNMYYLLHLSPH